MPVKDREKELNPSEKKYGAGSHDDLGVHPERREAEVDDLEKLYNAESAPEGQTSTKQEASETEKLGGSSEPTSNWDTNTEPKKKRRFKFNSRRAAASGGVAGFLVGGGIGFFGFLAGPMQFIHFAQVLQGFHFSNVTDLGDGRTGKLLRYATKGVTGSQAQDRNLSAAGNKIAVHYESKLRARGISMEYEFGRLNRIVIDPNTPQGRTLITEVEADSRTRLNIGDDGFVRLDLTDANIGNTASPKVRRSLIERSVKAAGVKRVSGWVATRMLKFRAAVNFHPVNVLRGLDENLKVRYDRYKKNRADAVQDGTKPDSSRLDLSESDASNPDTEESRARASEVTGVSDEVADIARDTNTPFKERVAAVQGKLTAGVGATAIVGLACGIQQVGEATADLQEANVILPLIRTGADAIAVGSQVMTGQDVNFEALGALSSSFYDAESKQTWAAAQSILAEQGVEGGKPIPESATPSRDKPGFFKALDSVISTIPGGNQVCSAINSTFGGIALTAAGIAATFTGPFAAAGSVATDVVQDKIVGIIIPNLVRWMAGEAVDVANFVGPDYGSIANYGSFLAANNTLQGMGGRALTNEERIALDTARQENIKNDMKTQSFYARMFKPTEPNSLFATTILGKPAFQSANATVASAVKLPTNVFSNIFGSLRALLPGVRAQAIPFDYGVDEYGFSLGEINSASVEDPYKNAAIVEPQLEALNEKYGAKCFGTTIDPTTKAIKYAQAPKYQELEANKSLCSEPAALPYRMYLADMIAMRSITCYEGIDSAACTEVGLTTPSSAPSTATNTSDVIVGDTSNLTCAAGEDAGVGDGYSKNQLYKIRLCNVQGITVNAQIATNVDQLLNTARASGIEFGGFGFRTMSRQIELRASNGCPDTYNSSSSSCRVPTAKPGYSNHQMGLAIDFTQGGSTLGSGSSGFNWLVNNAHLYGLKNLPSEAWHWSTTGG